MAKKTTDSTKGESTVRPDSLPSHEKGEVMGDVPKMRNPPSPPPAKGENMGIAYIPDIS